ncbi:MAG TPA: energy transducer TonB [Longimicrobium sp.]|nr:energy transducer TonB [Longimicrobium sp.]
MRTHVLLLALISAAAPAAAQQTGADPDPVYEMSEVEVPPRLQNPMQFTSTPDDADRRATRVGGGIVRLSYVIGADGRLRDVRVVRSSDRRLNEAAVRSALRMRYTPAQVDGQPVAVRAEVRMIWPRSPTSGSTAREARDRREIWSTNDRYSTEISVGPGYGGREATTRPIFGERAPEP